MAVLYGFEDFLASKFVLDEGAINASDEIDCNRTERGWGKVIENHGEPEV